jgi:PAS domain S-box-containing protein
MSILIRNINTIVSIFSSLVGLISLTTIFGWIFQIDQLVQINPNWPPMQFNTALCFLLNSIGIIFFIKNKKKLLSIIVLLIFSISIITISEYLFNLDSFIDQLFINHYNISHTSHAGRMSLNTAISFLFTAIFLSLTFVKNVRILLLIKGLVASIIFSFSFSSLIGYLSEIPTTFLWGGVTGMALHTVINFIIISSLFLLINYKKSNSENHIYWLPASLGLTLFIITLHLKYSIYSQPTNPDFISSFIKLFLFYGSTSSVLLIISVYFLLLNQSKKEIFKKANIESEKKFENAVKYSGIGMTLVSPEGKFLSANPALCNIIGYSEKEILDLDFQTITHPDDLDIDLKLVQKVLNDELQTYTLEKRYIRKSKEIIWINLTVSLVRDEEHQPLFFISQIMDINEKVKQRELLKKTNQELIETNNQLEQFASVASHDLKEPLRKIHSFCDLLKSSLDNKLDERDLKYFNYVMDAAQRMDILINDLLEFARIGQAKIEFIEADMNDTLKMALNNLEISIKETKAEITSNHLPIIYGSKNLLAQVFQNLISNALKFVPKDKTPQITISSQKSNENWVFQVKDNGIGIKKEYQEKIFKLFQRLHHRSEYPGTGLGLSICQRIIEKHNGHIWLESNTDSGATFFFSLPINP